MAAQDKARITASGRGAPSGTGRSSPSDAELRELGHHRPTVGGGRDVTIHVEDAAVEANIEGGPRGNPQPAPQHAVGTSHGLVGIAQDRVVDGQ